MNFILTKEQLDSLINYMIQKPYVEVFRPINMLQNLPQEEVAVPKLVKPSEKKAT